MGRSQMQGAPWHYEYLPNKKTKRNSINCAYNTGIRCSCSLSKHHGKPCVGEHNCSNFERCSFSRPEIYKNRNQNSKPYQNTKAGSNKTASVQKKYNPKTTVEKGNTVIVQALATEERIDIHVTDTKNPFYLKQMYEIIVIKGEKYKIIGIQKRG